MIGGLTGLTRSGNPFFSNSAISGSRVEGEEGGFTLRGAMLKFAFLFGLVLLSAFAVYYLTMTGKFTGRIRTIMYSASGLAGFGMMILIFSPKLTKYIAPIICIAEGVSLATLSMYYEARFPGLVLNAVMLTLLAVFAMFILWSSGLIKPQSKFMNFIMICTGAIGLLYLASWILGMFGVHLSFLHGGSPISIAISVVTTIVAAFNLIMDFGYLANAEKNNEPKGAEWTAAYGFCFTLIWLYFEILRLLYKLGLAGASDD